MTSSDSHSELAAANVRTYIVLTLTIPHTSLKMTDYVRRLVSGKKARHKDNDLDLELGQ